MKRVKVMTEILISIQDDRTNIAETILAIETALNAFYYRVLEQDSSWPDGIITPDKIGLRFHFNKIEGVDKMAVREKENGVELQEGMIKKGGTNSKPTFPRPPDAPKGQGPNQKDNEKCYD